MRLSANAAGAGRTATSAQTDQTGSNRLGNGCVGAVRPAHLATRKRIRSITIGCPKLEFYVGGGTELAVTPPVNVKPKVIEFSRNGLCGPLPLMLLLAEVVLAIAGCRQAKEGVRGTGAAGPSIHQP